MLALKSSLTFFYIKHSNCCCSFIHKCHQQHPSRISSIKCFLTWQTFNKMWFGKHSKQQREFLEMCMYFVTHKMCYHHHIINCVVRKYSTLLFSSLRNLVWFKSCYYIVFIDTDCSNKALKLSHCHSLSVAVWRSYKWLINNMSASPAHDKWILVTSAHAGRPQGQ